MKKMLWILAFGCFFSGLVNADGPQYLESLYIFNARNLEPFLNPQDYGECGWAAGLFGDVFPLEGGGTQDLYSVHTKKTNGEVLNGNVREIKKSGKLVTCFSEGYPVNERGLIFGEAGFIWRLIIDDKVYLVGGAGRYRTSPPIDFPDNFPEYGLGLLGATGTIVDPDLLFAPVGSMTTNALVNLVGNENYKPESIVTVRLYTPNPNINGD